jgi:hypothetical protein
MIFQFYGIWLTCLAVPIAIGWPISVLLGFGKGLRSIGLGAALGLSVALIACRSAEVWFPIRRATPWLWLAYLVITGAFWIFPRVRHAGIRLLKDCGMQVILIGGAAIGITAMLNKPILFDGAIEFDGTRNADSLTWASNARHMLDYSFDGVPRVDPAHPIFSITQSYIGNSAIQPRPASEGFLAWLSATWDVDPMYSFNAVQTAGVLLGGLSILLFLPDCLVRSWGKFAMILPLLLACPAIVFIAMNSNFPNGLTLAAATGYLGLGVLPRRLGTFIAAVLFLGCLMSGYPELMIFAGAIRVVATVGTFIAGRGWSWMWREAGFLALELATACILLPWAAKGMFVTYKTMLAMSHAGVTDQVGNMYAGIPFAIIVCLLFVITWVPLGKLKSDKDVRIFFLGILIVFAIAQLSMMIRGYAYGGFKLYEYFAAPMAVISVLCAAVILSETDVLVRSNRFFQVAYASILIAVVANVCEDIRMVRHSWVLGRDRRVTNDLVVAGDWLRQNMPEALVAMGSTPTAFYYGHWVPYATGAHLVYDWSDPNAAGYLSPYLRRVDKDVYAQAKIVLSIDNADIIHERQASDIAVFGDVHLSRKSW